MSRNKYLRIEDIKMIGNLHNHEEIWFLTNSEKHYLRNKGFSDEQIDEVDEGYRVGLKMNAYLDMNLSPEQMKEKRMQILNAIFEEKQLEQEDEFEL